MVELVRAKATMIGLAGVLALTMNVASAANNPTPVIAGPGAAIVNYLTPKVVLLKGRTLNFQNRDIAPHDVRSTNGLFNSALIHLNQVTRVYGAERLVKGSYGFYCSIHTNMKGTIIVK
jgi:plastocyanin